VHKSSQSSD